MGDRWQEKKKIEIEAELRSRFKIKVEVKIMKRRQRRLGFCRGDHWSPVCKITSKGDIPELQRTENRYQRTDSGIAS